MKLSRFTTLSLIAAFSAAAGLALGATGVTAQPTAGVTTPAFAKLPDSVIAEFKANPDSLLKTYASAGLPLSTQVRGLALTDPSLVAILIDLAKKANDAQKAAIGAGLAEAARVLATSNPALAAQIQQAVAQSGLGPLITAFIALSNGVTTAATGAGAGGGGGGGGAGSGGPTGGVGAFTGSNSGSNAGAFSFGQTNGASAFGTISGSGGGGSTVSTTQSTSASRSGT